MILFVFAQADDLSPPSTDSVIGKAICIGKCSLDCRSSPITSVLCVAGCVAKCRNRLSTTQYDCATSCALSKSVTVNAGINSSYSYLFYQLLV